MRLIQVAPITSHHISVVVSTLNRLIGDAVALDQAVAALAPGGTPTLTAKRVEVDCGPIPVREATWTINDAQATATSAVMAHISAAAPTGKDADEVGMDSFHLYAQAAGGQIIFTLKGLEGMIADRFAIDYLVMGAS